ncbi:MAG: RluA family pseudouridine synthase [Elusimicrobiota bacterium]|nr:RluA family pseudouridine synthase [Elusimicrobiota bacterium]
MSTTQTWVEVPFKPLKEQAGMRLDAFLAARLHKYSRAQVQAVIGEGRVYLRGRPAKPSARVADGETVLIRYPRTVEPPVPHETMPILYQDERLVVINKPGGTLSHPTDKVHHNTVTYLLSRQLGRPVHLAHRLDRETSGVLLLALDAAAARDIHGQFLAHAVKKEYLAVVLGAVDWAEKTVDAPIGDEGGVIKVRRAVGVAGGDDAVTDFRRLAGDGRFTLLSAKPRTGRLHQIRAHLASIGHPIAGDKLYHGNGEVYLKAVDKRLEPADLAALGAERQLLHAWRLSFQHPEDGRPLRFEAPVPVDFPLRPERA